MTTTRENAMGWWNSGRMAKCQADATRLYFPDRQTGSLTGSEIETMWEREVEDRYTDKIVRTWWLAKQETERRVLITNYFIGGNSKGINTLFGIMPEELEEIYHGTKDIKKAMLEKATKDFANSGVWQCPKSFEEGVKWERENMNINALNFEISALKSIINDLDAKMKSLYNEEEVKIIISEALQSALVKVDLKQWFKQFKKQ
jgi:hypothetical protein